MRARSVLEAGVRVAGVAGVCWAEAIGGDREQRDACVKKDGDIW